MPRRVTWESLSTETQNLFRTRGVGGVRGFRPSAEARKLFNKVPQQIKNAGERAVRDFLHRKEREPHTICVRNAPHLARDASNVTSRERMQKNLARGARNMSKTDLIQGKDRQWHVRHQDRGSSCTQERG